MRSRDIRVLGVPLDLGQTRRGVSMGPNAIRSAGLVERLRALGHTVSDEGDVAVGLAENRPVGNQRARYATEIATICGRVAKRVEKLTEQGATPLVLGGDHSIAIGTLPGTARNAGELGLIWFDAHSDINTPETSPSGNVHGMPLAYCFGLAKGAPSRVIGDKPPFVAGRTALVGVRDVDARERENIRAAGVQLLTMRDIDEDGMKLTMARALEQVCTGVEGVHLSLDLDALDPSEAPGVGTPRRGGVTYREAHLAMEMIADTGLLRSMDIVEVNPILDTANRTGELAVELALSAFGKRIA